MVVDLGTLGADDSAEAETVPESRQLTTGDGDDRVTWVAHAHESAWQMTLPLVVLVSVRLVKPTISVNMMAR